MVTDAAADFARDSAPSRPQRTLCALPYKSLALLLLRPLFPLGQIGARLVKFLNGGPQFCRRSRTNPSPTRYRAAYFWSPSDHLVSAHLPNLNRDVPPHQTIEDELYWISPTPCHLRPLLLVISGNYRARRPQKRLHLIALLPVCISSVTEKPLNIVGDLLQCADSPATRRKTNPVSPLSPLSQSTVGSEPSGPDLVTYPKGYE
jgi:hypothetical protein